MPPDRVWEMGSNQVTQLFFCRFQQKLKKNSNVEHSFTYRLYHILPHAESYSSKKTHAVPLSVPTCFGLLYLWKRMGVVVYSLGSNGGIRASLIDILPVLEMTFSSLILSSYSVLVNNYKSRHFRCRRLHRSHTNIQDIISYKKTKQKKKETRIYVS